MIVLTTNTEGYATASLACFMGTLRWPDVAFFALNAEDPEDLEICRIRGIDTSQVLNENGLMLTIFGIQPGHESELPFPDRNLTADEFASFTELLGAMGGDPNELSNAAGQYADGDVIGDVSEDELEAAFRELLVALGSASGVEPGELFAD